jgi:hypothetical protein
MDLSRFDTREKAHEGVDVPLVVGGETALGSDGQPVTFRLRGAHDPAVQQLLLAGRRAESRTPAEVLAADMKLARVAVLGWSDNLELDGERLAFSPEALGRLFAIPAIRKAVLAEVFDDARFMNGA